MADWSKDVRTKIKEDRKSSAGNEIHSCITEQFFKVMETREPTYTRMNGIVSIMIPREFVLVNGLNKCINWKKLKKEQKNNHKLEG
jgi:hypothetical protein